MRMRLNWRVRAVLPVAAVLAAGLLLFFWVSLTLDKTDERQRVILVAAAGAVAICAAMLVALAFLIQRPLVELQDKIARVRDGDLSVSVNFAGRTDEIGQIGRDFNEMVRQMRQGREQAERLLAAANTQMTRAEHLATLGELAAGLAHEIRNPLAGIAGVIEIIGRDLPQTSPAREVLQEVQHEVLHIKRILSDLLDYARPRAPDFRLTDLNSTVEHAAALARQQALSRPIKIEVQRADGLPPVEHDTAQIQQVLLNLLLNAIQAIPAEGRVTVSVEARGGFAHVAVSDTGRGIAPEHLPSIFRPFFTTKGQGTGLGLSLARRIVESHGGRLEVTSQLGKGSVFSAWLPLRRPAENAAS